ncbi:MAG: dephospho-CoA kinase [Candidatus Neomarinimicrobiota bacterium]
MLKVGLTGGIGSGKSTVSKMLAELGAYIFDADIRAKQILDENTVVQNELISEFGTDILDPDGQISRGKLSRVGFQDEDHQLRLNSIIHPFVADAVDTEYKALSAKNKYPLFVFDAALIYEADLDLHMDYIIVVSSAMKHRMERALKRGNLSREDILRRMDLQWPDEQKVGMADFVIRNNGTEEQLREQVEEIYRQLI